MTLYCCSFLQKSKKPFFIKLDQPHLGSTLGILGPKTSRRKFYSRNPTPSLFKLDGTLISCKISENFYEWLLRKTPDQQINRLMEQANRQSDKRTKGISQEFHFVGPKRGLLSAFKLWSIPI